MCRLKRSVSSRCRSCVLQTESLTVLWLMLETKCYQGDYTETVAGQPPPYPHSKNVHSITQTHKRAFWIWVSRAVETVLTFTSHNTLYLTKKNKEQKHCRWRRRRRTRRRRKTWTNLSSTQVTVFCIYLATHMCENHWPLGAHMPLSSVPLSVSVRAVQAASYGPWQLPYFPPPLNKTAEPLPDREGERDRQLWIQSSHLFMVMQFF